MFFVGKNPLEKMDREEYTKFKEKLMREFGRERFWSRKNALDREYPNKRPLEIYQIMEEELNRRKQTPTQSQPVESSLQRMQQSQPEPNRMIAQSQPTRVASQLQPTQQIQPSRVFPQSTPSSSPLSSSVSQQPILRPQPLQAQNRVILQSTLTSQPAQVSSSSVTQQPVSRSEPFQVPSRLQNVNVISSDSDSNSDSDNDVYPSSKKRVRETSFDRSPRKDETTQTLENQKNEIRRELEKLKREEERLETAWEQIAAETQRTQELRKIVWEREDKIKEREQNMQKLQEEIQRREHDVQKRQEEVQQREQKARWLQQSLEQRETILQQHEQTLQQREQSFKHKQELFHHREKTLRQQIQLQENMITSLTQASEPSYASCVRLQKMIAEAILDHNTKLMVTDPVVLQDGHVYERTLLQILFQENTNNTFLTIDGQLVEKEFVPVNNLRKLAQAFQAYIAEEKQDYDVVLQEMDGDVLMATQIQSVKMNYTKEYLEAYAQNNNMSSIMRQFMSVVIFEKKLSTKNHILFNKLIVKNQDLDLSTSEELLIEFDWLNLTVKPILLAFALRKIGLLNSDENAFRHADNYHSDLFTQLDPNELFVPVSRSRS